MSRITREEAHARISRYFEDTTRTGSDYAGLVDLLLEVQDRVARKCAEIADSSHWRRESFEAADRAMFVRKEIAVAFSLSLDAPEEQEPEIGAAPEPPASRKKRCKFCGKIWVGASHYCVTCLTGSYVEDYKTAAPSTPDPKDPEPMSEEELAKHTTTGMLHRGHDCARDGHVFGASTPRAWKRVVLFHCSYCDFRSEKMSDFGPKPEQTECERWDSKPNEPAPAEEDPIPRQQFFELLATVRDLRFRIDKLEGGL